MFEFTIVLEEMDLVVWTLEEITFVTKIKFVEIFSNLSSFLVVQMLNIVKVMAARTTSEAWEGLFHIRIKMRFDREDKSKVFPNFDSTQLLTWQAKG